MIKLEVGKKYRLSNGEVLECVAVWSKKSPSDEQATMMNSALIPSTYTLDGESLHVSKYDVVEEYKSKLRPFRVGDVTKTRDGRKARVICVDRRGHQKLTLVALVIGNTDEEELIPYYLNGRFKPWPSEDIEDDLVPMYEE